MTYATAGDVYALLPNIGSLSDLTSAQVLEVFIKPAEAEMNAKLSKYYTVPVTGTVPLLQAISTEIAIYRALTLRVFTASMLKESAWPDRYKRAHEMLDELANGKWNLVDSAGVVVAGRAGFATAHSNTMDYLPTFHEGGVAEDQVKDPEKNDDLLSERDLIS